MRQQAQEWWARAKQAAEALTIKGASICLGAGLPEEMVRALADVSGGECHAAVHVIGEQALVICAFTSHHAGVEIRGQGDRPATAADAELPGWRSGQGEQMGRADVLAAVGGEP